MSIYDNRLYFPNGLFTTHLGIMMHGPIKVGSFSFFHSEDSVGCRKIIQPYIDLRYMDQALRFVFYRFRPSSRIDKMIDDLGYYMFQQKDIRVTKQERVVGWPQLTVQRCPPP